MRPIDKPLYRVDTIHEPGTYGPSFEVRAQSTRGAFFAVRRRYQHMLTDHNDKQLWALSCNGIISDKKGETINYAEVIELKRAADLIKP